MFLAPSNDLVFKAAKINAMAHQMPNISKSVTDETELTLEKLDKLAKRFLAPIKNVTAKCHRPIK